MFNPKFTITPRLNVQIAEIEKLKTIFEHAKILPQLAVELRFRATVESVHSSTAIEGNPLNPQQVQKILDGKNITAPDYAIQEVLNYKNALNWLSQEKNIKETFGIDKILELHKILMINLLPKEKVGKLRPGNVYIVDEVDNKEVIQFTGPDAKDLKKLLNSFLEWVASQKKEGILHPVLLAGLIHYIFVSIHPFSDGNGRTTRLLTHHYLKSVNYHFNDSLSLDSYYLQNKQDYYRALSRGKTLRARIFSDVTPFLEFFVDGFLQSVQNLTQYAQMGKIVDRNEKPIRLNQEELIILDYVYQFGSISIGEALQITPTTRRTIQRRLSSLVQKNILETKGAGPAASYILRIS